MKCSLKNQTNKQNVVQTKKIVIDQVLWVWWECEMLTKWLLSVWKTLSYWLQFNEMLRWLLGECVLCAVLCVCMYHWSRLLSHHTHTTTTTTTAIGLDRMVMPFSLCYTITITATTSPPNTRGNFFFFFKFSFTHNENGTSVLLLVCGCCLVRTKYSMFYENLWDKSHLKTAPKKKETTNETQTVWVCKCWKCASANSTHRKRHVEMMWDRNHYGLWIFKIYLRRLQLKFQARNKKTETVRLWREKKKQRFMWNALSVLLYVFFFHASSFPLPPICCFFVFLLLCCALQITMTILQIDKEILINFRMNKKRFALSSV